MSVENRHMEITEQKFEMLKEQNSPGNKLFLQLANIK